MKKILLTSAGFDNKKVADKFLELVDKPVCGSRCYYGITSMHRGPNQSLWNKSG